MTLNGNGTFGHFRERIAELEFAIEDAGWTKISFDSSREFSRDFLRKLVKLSRVYYLKNPLVNRGVNVQSYYVWGQGVNIHARDKRIQLIIDQFIDDDGNQAELTSHQARTMKECALQVEGNIFFVLFTEPATGLVHIRSIPSDQVVDIICDPDDAKSHWYYKRSWSDSRFNTGSGQYETASRTAYYPDWLYSPQTKPAKIGDDPVEWGAPVYHVRVGGLPDMRFGIPETYSALDWARAYKDFLEDVATLMRSYTRFAGQLTTKGGSVAVAEAESRLGTTVSTDGALDSNPPPLAGSIFISGDPDTQYKPFNLRGASISPEDGRRILLMVAAALGLPETFFGDVSVGTLATARSLDRPTELKFRDRQTLWGDVLHDILQYQVDQAVGAPRGMLSQVGTAATLKGIGGFVDPNQIDRTITIGFPPILEHDIDQIVGSIVKAATLGGQGAFAGTLSPEITTRMLLEALREDDIDELMGQLFPGSDNGEAPEANIAATAGSGSNANTPPGTDTDTDNMGAGSMSKGVGNA